MQESNGPESSEKEKHILTSLSELESNAERVWDNLSEIAGWAWGRVKKMNLAADRVENLSRRVDELERSRK